MDSKPVDWKFKTSNATSNHRVIQIPNRESELRKSQNSDPGGIWEIGRYSAVHILKIRFRTVLRLRWALIPLKFNHIHTFTDHLPTLIKQTTACPLSFNGFPPEGATTVLAEILDTAASSISFNGQRSLNPIKGYDYKLITHIMK